MSWAKTYLGIISVGLNIQNYLRNGKTVIDLEKEFGIYSYNHPNLPLVGFKYGIIQSDEVKFHPIVREARGIVLERDSWNIVAYPFDRFFNLGEDGETEKRFNWNNFVCQEKVDGCFPYKTKLNLWNGGTITIGQVVNNELYPELIGMDSEGNIVPCQITKHFNNGKKEKWIDIFTTARIWFPKTTGGSNSRYPNRLRVTPNHYIFVNGKFIPAIEAKIGDIVTNYNLKPSKSVLHLIRSALLGDGSIFPCSNSFRFSDGHKQSHKEYTKKISRWLGQCGIDVSNRISGFGSLMYDASSKNYQHLSKLREEWYPNEIKEIPEDLSWMDDFTIAKWYMDDGSLSHSEYQEDRACFSTNGFIENDVIRLCEKLNSKYNVHAVHYFSKGWNIRVNSGYGNEIDNLWRSIAPHIVPCMRYKLPERYRSVDYIEYPYGLEEKYPIDAVITDIKDVEYNKKNFPNGASGFDIETTTHNYFAKGILVHNSLMIVYNYDGTWHVNTSGSFGKGICYDSGVSWEELFWETSGFNPNVLIAKNTYIFELWTKYNKIVRSYDKPHVTLLSIRSDLNHQEWKTDLVDEFAGSLKIKRPLKYPFTSRTEIIDFLLHTSQSDPTFEGFVLCDSGFRRIKVKSDSYKQLHVLKGNGQFLYRNIIPQLLRGNFSELSQNFPEWLEELEQCKDKLNKIIISIQHLWDNVKHIESRKDFAQAVINKCDLPAILFHMKDGKYSNITEAINKNENMIIKHFEGKK